jgi:hypothetical protein
MNVTASAMAGWVLVASFAQGSVWREEKPAGGVPVYRAEGTIDAPVRAVRAVLLAPARYPGCTPSLAEERLVRSEACAEGATGFPGCRRIWMYNRYEPPLVGKRDATLALEIADDDPEGERGFVLAWQLSADHQPARGTVPMRLNSGSWTLRADGGRTRYVYVSQMDPGGSLPGWVVRTVNEREVPKLVGAVERAAKRMAVASGSQQ